MSEWTERVVSHQIWQQMEAFGRAMDEALKREGIDSTSVAGIERLRSTLAFVGKRLAATEPALIQPAPLNALSEHLQAAGNELTAYASDGASGHIANANSHADAMLGQIASINYPLGSEDLEALREAAIHYRATVEQIMERLQAGYTGLSNEASASVAQVQNEGAAAQQKLQELAAEVSAERARLSSITADFQAQFSSAQDSRGRDFSDAQNARQDKFNGLFVDFTQKLTEQNAEFTAQRGAAFRQYEADVAELKKHYSDSGQAILDEITRQKQAVEKLVGVIGNLGVTSGYQKAANYARWATLVWQGVTVSALVAVIVFAFKAFLPLLQEHQQQGTFSWPNFVSRVVLSIAVGVLAAYAAAQGDKWMEIDRRNRKLALELQAIGPYLAPLPPEKAEAFRIQLGERTFGRDETGIGRRTSDRSPATILDVALKSKDMRDFVVELVKAAKG